MTARELATYLQGVRPSGDEFTARCPGHDDKRASLSFRDGERGLVMTCFAGCTFEEIVAALGLNPQDFFNSNGQSTGHGCPPPLTLAAFAQAKGLPVEFLREQGVYEDGVSLIITYRLRDGSLAPRQRRRLALAAREGSVWDGPRGVSPVAYGLWRLEDATEKGELFLVEGETDALTAWSHNIPSLGLPGADMAKCLTAEALEGVDVLHVIQEPDRGGDTFVRRVGARLKDLGWSGQAFAVRLPVKDLSELHLTAGERFADELLQTKAAAVPLADVAPTAESSTGDVILQPLTVLSATDFLAKEFTARGSIISGGNLPTGGKLVIVGPGGLGKSLIALSAGLSLASGRAVLDEFPVSAPQCVGVFLCEDPAGETQSRLKQQLRGQEPPKGLFIFTREERLLLAGPRGKPNEEALGRLVETVKQYALSVVIFDPLVALHESDENSNSEMARWLYRLSAALEPVNCAIIMTHHVTWGQDGDTHSRGATAIQNWADTVWHLRQITPSGREAVKLTIAKINFGPRWDPLVLTLDPDSLLFRAESEQGALCPVPALLGWFRDEHNGVFHGKKGDLYGQVQERFGCGLRTAREAFRLALSHQPPLLKDLGRGSGFEVIA